MIGRRHLEKIARRQVMSVIAAFPSAESDFCRVLGALDSRLSTATSIAAAAFRRVTNERSAHLIRQRSAAVIGLDDFYFR